MRFEFAHNNDCVCVGDGHEPDFPPQAFHIVARNQRVYVDIEAPLALFDRLWALAIDEAHAEDDVMRAPLYALASMRACWDHPSLENRQVTLLGHSWLITPHA